MSFVVVRTYLQDNHADVLACPRERDAQRTFETMRDFWNVAIERKQVAVEYLGKSLLPAGIYMALIPNVIWPEQKGEA